MSDCKTGFLDWAVIGCMIFTSLMLIWFLLIVSNLAIHPAIFAFFVSVVAAILTMTGYLIRDKLKTESL